MVSEVKKELYRSVLTARDVVWSPRWSNSALACTLSRVDLAITAEARERSSTKRTNVRTAMERR